jgi:hypothetical protein
MMVSVHSLLLRKVVVTASHLIRSNKCSSHTKQREFSPTYSELPPREIYVEASGQSENVLVTSTSATSESERLLQFPSARRVADDPKTKIFTFEGLTPVSTADDTREDAIVSDILLDNENGVTRDDNFIASSPLASDLTLDKDQNDDTNYGMDNAQIVSVSSSVREKVAAWEKRVISWRSTDMYDVPFDEDPMRKNACKIENVDTPVVLIGDEFDMSKETITEIPLDEIFESEIQCGDTGNAETVEKSAIEALPVTNEFSVLKSEVPTVNLIASMTNLLDEEDEPEIHAAPSDENEASEAIDIEKRDMPEPMGNDSATPVTTTSLVETFGCPNAICSQVSKLWQS